MKEAEDITIKTKDTIANAEAIRPISATTPAMMAHFRRYLQLSHSNNELLVGAGFAVLGPRLTADPKADPFIIQLSNPIYTKRQVAYLSLANGTVEWRYSRVAVRYARCPVVRDPIRMRWLDGLFAAFYLEAELPESLNGALEMLGPWDRERWVRTNLFEGGRPEETLRFRKREVKAFPAGKKQPILYLANVLNSILQPDYELRRFTDPKLGKDGILMPLAPGDWEALTDAYGANAIEARFKGISKQLTEGGTP